MGTSAFVYKEIMQRTFMGGAVLFTTLPTPSGRPPAGTIPIKK